MRKAFIALGVVIAALLIAFITFNQQPKYADVSMPKADYTHLQESRTNIKRLIDDLSKFNYKKDSTMVAIEKDAKIIANENSKDLSSSDAQTLRDALYGKMVLSQSLKPHKLVNTTLTLVLLHVSIPDSIQSLPCLSTQSIKALLSAQILLLR